MKRALFNVCEDELAARGREIADGAQRSEVGLAREINGHAEPRKNGWRRPMPKP